MGIVLQDTICSLQPLWTISVMESWMPQMRKLLQLQSLRMRMVLFRRLPQGYDTMLRDGDGAEL